MIENIMFAGLCSLVATLLFGGKVIDILRTKQGRGQPIRTDGPKTHIASKQGTPTMGGLLIIATSMIATIAFAKISNPFILVSLSVLLVYGVMGFIDDYIKVTKQTANAMSAKTKLFIQFLVSGIAIVLVTYFTDDKIQYSVSIPFLREASLNLWYFYVPFAMVVVAGASNAINLTDGLDGLASGLLVFVFVVFLFASYTSQIEYAQELSILCSALIGALLGFLRFNKNPAKVFMGDTGSLALGALIGILSVMLKSELLLALVGFVFVVEALSVMVQVASYKLRGKRFFLMAPIHHHFEERGWGEKKVVLVFWGVGFALMLVGLLVL